MGAVSRPDRGGRGGVRGLEEIFTAGEITVEDLIDAGDSLVALVRFRVVSVGGDVPLDHVWGYVCQARDGKLAHLRAYWEPDAALAAAGVDSP